MSGNMVTLLQRYITKTILLATSVVTIIITGILFMLSVIGEMRNMGQGDYHLTQVLLYVILRLPNQLYQFSPLLVLLGSIIGLSMLTSHRELTVMRACGFSVFNIIKSVLGAAIILVLAISVLGETFSPDLSYKAEIGKENARNAGEAVVTTGGVWFHVNNNFIHVQQMIGRQLLKDVTRFEFDNNNELQATYFVKQLTNENNQWKMKEVVKTTFAPNKTISEVINEAPWDIPFNLNLLNLGLIEANEMTLGKLASYTRYLKQNGLQASEYQYNYWQRVMQPLAALIMVFLAIPFVLATFSQTTTGWRIILGIIVGFTFFIINSLLGQLCIVYQIPPLIAAILPIILFAIIGVILNKQLVRR